MYFFEGTLEGRIALGRSGSGGFGYDPVFIADEYPQCSVAELPEEVKNAISHRGKALRAMARWLQERE
jgi:XTP/dITP diphosphohydrolase